MDLVSTNDPPGADLLRRVTWFCGPASSGSAPPVDPTVINLLAVIDRGDPLRYSLEVCRPTQHEEDNPRAAVGLMPALLAGFDNSSSKENVGVHEFAHLVENEESDHGLPPEGPRAAVKR